MTEPGIASSTGSQFTSDLRRRNVQRTEGPSLVHDDTKKVEKEMHLEPDSILPVLDRWEPLIVPILLTALSIFTRMYRIGRSNIVTWDEAHFGKFGSHYLKREFYFDVHPPLGKMLVGLSGLLAGYNGSFEFKSGEKYPDDVNYTFMRAFNAAFGVVTLAKHLMARVANLRGTDVGKDSPLEIAIGSRVTLKNMGYGGGLLHSHIQTYPEGSTQQQVTCYHHKDANNDWFIYPNRHEPDYDPHAPLRFISDGDLIRLIHGQTGRNLHSHAIPAPITKSQHEVSCYGNITIGDDKDHWAIEVVDDVASKDRSKIRTLTTAFRLRHPVLGCYLRAGNVNLPQWGFKQIETTCVKENKLSDVYTHWNIESHFNDRLPPGDPGSYKSPFLKDFIHLNVAMMTSNNALVPDPDKQDDLASKFWQWPILNVGLRMCSWDDNTIKYYLLGNPLVYWGSTFSLGIFGLLIIWYLVRWQRGYRELSQADIDHIHYSGLYPAIGWILHYLPFVIMARVTYVHHYYPALYYAILTFGFCIDWLTQKLNNKFRWVLYACLYTTITGMFMYFRVIVFGIEGPSQEWSHLNWRSGWRI
ncbi:protein O-mannosyl transferase [Aspergillus tanneri]|uniref:Dolichyl-phosphate-mannose--protein mannosyltransferase n=1 Tax=Aspergillus tanneri TaxID=1220188 RepID=A0A5M9MQF2_9EURO|nr:Protein O-mannosyltransferase 2 [Aspergillus tanneri]KAA8647530.1 Protein O-mannosyltransferase 2 [Aspergillus tanneri]